MSYEIETQYYANKKGVERIAYNVRDVKTMKLVFTTWNNKENAEELIVKLHLIERIINSFMYDKTIKAVENYEQEHLDEVLK
jgi:hypothetical protein